MTELNFGNKLLNPPPAGNFPLLHKIKDAYTLWYEYYHILPKPHRHSLGVRIDTFFIEAIEALAVAGFLQKTEKQPYVRLTIRKLDTLKILLMILFENKSLEEKKYIALSVKLYEIGKMLGGWNGQLQKQNSPDVAPGKK